MWAAGAASPGLLLQEQATSPLTLCSLSLCPSLARTRIPRRHAGKNEDFVSDKAGASLLEDVEIDTVLEELNEAHDWLMDWSGGELDWHKVIEPARSYEDANLTES